MPNNLPRPSRQVQASREFKHSLKVLSKKYHHIRSDVEPIINRLLSGEIVGDRIPDVGYTVFKERAPNQDARKGKSGGYRLIYWLQSDTSIILIAIYSKSDQSDISNQYVRDVIEHFRKSSR